MSLENMNNSHYKKAMQSYAQKAYEEAIVHFTSAIEQEPSNAEFFYQRGISYFHLNKKSLALIDFNEALELQPKNPFRYASRAYIKDACGDLNGAILDYERALELDPKDAISHNNLGLLQEKKGYKEKAKSSFTKADELALEEDFLKFPSNKSESDKKNEEEITNHNMQNKVGFFQVIQQVFTDKNTFNEFITFVKNGFK